jgi:HAD superfamily hydrolase (TIGR01549 family)
MSKYETVLFDFGGTLDADGVAWKERAHRHYEAEGMAISAEAFAPLFYAADDRLCGTIAREADLSATLAELTANLESEFTRGGIAYDRALPKRAAARFLAESTEAFVRNRAVLEQLGQRYRLGIVSNFYGNLQAVCMGAGVMVDSQQVGFEKPDPAIFKAALEPLGAVPERTVFVGDSLNRDREGARRIGMDFIWIAPVETQRAEAGAGRYSSDHPVIARFGDLAALLS